MGIISFGGRRGARSRRSLVAATVAATVTLTTATAAAAGTSATAPSAPPSRRVARESRRLGPPGLAKRPTQRLVQPAGVPATRSTKVAARKADPIDMKVLVISADGGEADLPAIRDALDYLGTPYTVHVATQSPGGLTADKLFSGVHAFYQGVILATGSLVYNNGSGWVSALTPTEWQTLWSFEGQFGIRQVSWYTYPTPDYGFTGTPTAVDTTGAPLPTTYTPDGAQVFSYANAANPLAVQDAYTYLAPAATDGLSTTLLRDSQGNALAVVRTYPDQGSRQNLALTFASNPNLVHDMVLSYGLVDWVTKGLHLGERHAYLEPQPDDMFIDDTTWPAGTACGTNVEDPSLPTYRITGADLQAFLAWQQTVQPQPTSAALAPELPFNGVGTSDMYTPDTLTPAAQQNQARFKWLSHTWDHENLDAISYSAAVTEIRQNNTAATTLGLTTYNRSNLVTPDVSGLTNGQFLQAAFDNGIRYLVSDTSRPGYNNPSPNAGIYNSLQPAILMEPRHPTNLYFNVTTPAEWLAEDNCLYPAGAFGHVDTYSQLLDRESSVMLSYLLRGDIDPLMFHQPNMRAYDDTRSLLGDLVDATLAKYNKLVTLPILSPPMDQVGQKMAQRMQYNGAGVTASIVPGQSIMLTAQNAATVPVTGLKTPGAEVYGGQSISYVQLSAGQSVTLPLG